jgi:MFS family permease
LLPIIYGTSWPLVVIGRFFIGICSSAAIIGAFQSFRMLFPTHFSQVLGAMVCVGIITAVNISKPLLFIRDAIGIFSMLTALSIGGIILALFSWIALPKEERFDRESSFQMVKEIASKPLFWIASIFAGLMVAPLEGFADTHATAFLFALYQIPRIIGDSIAFYILIGMCVGAIVLPYIAEKTNQYYVLTAFSAFSMAACFLLMFFYTIPVHALHIVYFIIGFFSAYQVIILSKIASYYTASLAGLAGAVANMIVMSFGYFFNTAIGFSLDYFWDNAMLKEAVREYSKVTYIKAISIIPITLCIAGVGFLLISIYRRKENREL